MFYYENDPNGAPVRLRSQDGQVVWEAHYGVTGGVDHLEAKAVDQPVRLQGQYWDAESGLNYNRYRYYDPNTGYFISQDPIGLEGGPNPYQFAPNVFGWIDPLGLSTKAFRNKLRQIMEKAEKKEGESGCAFAVDRRTANNLGEEFVGEGYTVQRGTRHGEIWLVSADGKRLYRSPTAKSSSYARTGTQANFHMKGNKNDSFFDIQKSSNVHVHVQ